MDTDTHDALMAAILANPEADLPRLVYADFLQENNAKPYHERLIRSQFDGRAFPGLSLVMLMDYEPLLGCLAHQTTRHSNKVEATVSTKGGLKLTFRRGFLDQIDCSLGWWMGCGCPRCNDSGLTYVYTGHGDYEEQDCWDCELRVANGPKVVAEHPVTKVTVSDVWPLLVQHGENVSEWQWHRQSEESRRLETTSQLPANVFRFLTGGRLIGYWLRYYETRLQAEDDLSTALLCAARDNHGRD